MASQVFGNLLRRTRNLGPPRRLAKGNLELWANLFVITWAAAFMLWQGVGFAITIGTVFAIWAILAVSLNLVVGYTGLLSVGHVGFFGVGAYAMAILSSGASYDQLRTEAIPTFGWPFFAALPVSVARPDWWPLSWASHSTGLGTISTFSSHLASPSLPSISF